MKTEEEIREDNPINEEGKINPEIVDEDIETVSGSEVGETRNLSFTAKRTGNRTVKMDNMEDGHHAPVTTMREAIDSTMNFLKKRQFRSLSD